MASDMAASGAAASKTSSAAAAGRSDGRDDEHDAGAGGMRAHDMRADMRWLFGLRKPLADAALGSPGVRRSGRLAAGERQRRGGNIGETLGGLEAGKLRQVNPAPVVEFVVRGEVARQPAGGE